VTQRHMLENSK